MDFWEYDDRSNTYRRGTLVVVPDWVGLLPTFSARVGPADAESIDALIEQWRERGDHPEVGLAGEATLLGRRTQIVEIRPPGGGVVRAFVDPERMFIMRWAGDGDGGGQSYSSEVTALEYDTEIDAGRFTFDPPPGAREVVTLPLKYDPVMRQLPPVRSAERPSSSSPASSAPRTAPPGFDSTVGVSYEGERHRRLRFDSRLRPARSARWRLHPPPSAPPSRRHPPGGALVATCRLRPRGGLPALRRRRPQPSLARRGRRRPPRERLGLLRRASPHRRVLRALYHLRLDARALRSEASRRGRAPAPQSGRVLVHSSSARQRQLLLRRCGDWTRCGTMRRKEPDALAAWASGVRVPWSADWRADASCEGGTDDIRGEGCDRHEPRPSLDALRAFRGRGAGPLQGVRRGARIPRESFQPVLAGAGQETPDGSPELASPRTPGTRRRRHGSRVPSPNRGASRAPFLLP